MIEIKLKGERDNIEKMLGRYRRKRKTIGLNKELWERKYHTKKSISRREEIQKAAYKLSKFEK